jgi:5-formyltetrahydrofolate cyclo-ligase
MDLLHTSKGELRRRFKQLRLSAQAQVADPLLQVALEQLPAAAASPGHIGLYWPLPGEADLRALAALEPWQTRLALPRVRHGCLQYCPWSPATPLEPDESGILAPGGEAVLPAEQMSLLLVPALALDRQGIRLGYGGGWFDRLRANPAWRAVPALGVLPSACLVEALPADPWDVPFAGWLDEHGLHWIEA